MLALEIILEEPAWPDLGEEFIHLGNSASAIGITCLSRGMSSGAPSVALRLDLPDGRVVIAETSLKLFLTAADIFKAKYGDPRI